MFRVVYDTTYASLIWLPFTLKNTDGTPYTSSPQSFEVYYKRSDTPYSSWILLSSGTHYNVYPAVAHTSDSSVGRMFVLRLSPEFFSGYISTLPQGGTFELRVRAVGPYSEWIRIPCYVDRYTTADIIKKMEKTSVLIKGVERILRKAIGITPVYGDNWSRDKEQGFFWERFCVTDLGQIIFDNGQGFLGIYDAYSDARLHALNYAPVAKKPFSSTTYIRKIWWLKEDSVILLGSDNSLYVTSLSTPDYDTALFVTANGQIKEVAVYDKKIHVLWDNSGSLQIRRYDVDNQLYIDTINTPFSTPDFYFTNYDSTFAIDSQGRLLLLKQGQVHVYDYDYQQNDFSLLSVVGSPGEYTSFAIDETDRLYAAGASEGKIDIYSDVMGTQLITTLYEDWDDNWYMGTLRVGGGVCACYADDYGYGYVWIDKDFHYDVTLGNRASQSSVDALPSEIDTQLSSQHGPGSWEGGGGASVVLPVMQGQVYTAVATQEKEVKIVRGDTPRIYFDLGDDYTGWQVWFGAKERLSDDNYAIDAKQGSWTDASKGQGYIELTEAETQNTGKYYAELELRSPDGTQKLTAMKFILTIIEDVIK